MPLGELSIDRLTARFPGMERMEWQEAINSFRSRNVRRYYDETSNRMGMGAMVLMPRPGENGIDNPITTIHVQGLESAITDGLIIWEFSFFGPIRCYSRWFDERIMPNGGM